MPGTISKTAAATDTISTEVDRAYKALSAMQGRMVDGHGIYSDPSRCRQAITAARNALNNALETMAATAWSTDADYDAAEQSSDWPA